MRKTFPGIDLVFQEDVTFSELRNATDFKGIFQKKVVYRLTQQHRNTFPQRRGERGERFLSNAEQPSGKKGSKEKEKASCPFPPCIKSKSKMFSCYEKKRGGGAIRGGKGQLRFYAFLRVPMSIVLIIN